MKPVIEIDDERRRVLLTSDFNVMSRDLIGDGRPHLEQAGGVVGTGGHRATLCGLRSMSMSD